MANRAVVAVVCAVVLLTIVNHAWWTPALSYPLYLGIIASKFAMGGHVQTLTRDKIGFAIEVLTNIAVYALAIVFVVRSTRSR